MAEPHFAVRGYNEEGFNTTRLAPPVFALRATTRQPSLASLREGTAWLAEP
jgi:hypothetical protein